MAGVLWLADKSTTGAPVLWASAVILLVCLREVGRMGRLAGTGLGLVLTPPALAVLYLAWRATDPAGAASAAHVYRPSLLIESLVAVLLAITCQGLLRLARRGGVLSVVGVVVVTTYLLLIGWLFGRGSEAIHLGTDTGGPRLLVLSLSLPALWSLLDTLKREEDRRRFTEAGCFALWLIVPLASLVHVWSSFGQSGLIALIVLSKIGDVAGYYGGNAFGRTHPFPRISPGKTTAGCVASLLAAAAAGGLLVHFEVLPAGRLGLLGGVLAGTAVNLAAQAGDLLESKVKRWAGVKDAGTWFGPSGGMLDLVDSVLLSVPTALVLWPWLFGAP